MIFYTNKVLRYRQGRAGQYMAVGDKEKIGGVGGGGLNYMRDVSCAILPLYICYLVLCCLCLVVLCLCNVAGVGP